MLAEPAAALSWAASIPAVIRRKRLPPDLVPIHDAFRLAAEPVERAKEALIEAVPTGRGPGRPLADALLDFEQDLRTAQELMPAWRHSVTERDWLACDEALRESLAQAEALRSEPPHLGFESLQWTVGELIGPLEAFYAAAERFIELRR